MCGSCNQPRPATDLTLLFHCFRSGVCSNQLSYRPALPCLFCTWPRCHSSLNRSCAHAHSLNHSSRALPRTKNPAPKPRTITVLHQSNPLSRACFDQAICVSTYRANQLSVKEVIQPQVPLGLPCYDFTPVMNHKVVAPSRRLSNLLLLQPTPMV